MKTATTNAAQFLADVTGLAVARPAVLEATAWGAAALAGLHCGAFDSLDDISTAWRCDQEFQPAATAKSIAGWEDALRRVKTATPATPRTSPLATPAFC